MKLNANQLRSIISETVKASKRRRLGEGPVPPSDSTLSTRTAPRAVDTEAISDAVMTLVEAIVAEATTTLALTDEQSMNLSDTAHVDIHNDLLDIAEQWVKEIAGWAESGELG